MKRDRQSDLVVVRRQPGLRLRQFCILLLFSVGAAVAGFLLGMMQAEFRGRDAVQTRAVLEEQVETLRSDNDRLRQTLLQLERGRSIDEQTIREAQRTIMQLQTDLSQMNSDLGFFKNIMAPGDVEKSLQVQRMLLIPANRENSFVYKLSLTQIGDNSSYVGGQVNVNVLGKRGDEPVSIPLKDVSQEVEKIGIIFRFRYFQDIEGELTLPDGFTAEAVEVIAQAEGDKAVRVERTFEWRKLIGE